MPSGIGLEHEDVVTRFRSLAEENSSMNWRALSGVALRAVAVCPPLLLASVEAIASPPAFVINFSDDVRASVVEVADSPTPSPRPSAAMSIDATIASLHEEAQRTAAAGDVTSSMKCRLQEGDLLFGGARFAEALAAFQGVLVSARETGDPSAGARALNSLGDVRAQTGDHPGANRCHLHALAAFRAAHDRIGEAIALGSLGSDHFRIGDLEGAFKNTSEALALFREFDDRRRIEGALLNSGAFWLTIGRIDNAMPCFKEALSLARQLDDAENVEGALINIGHVLMGSGDSSKAEACFSRALRFSKANRHGLAEAAALSCLGVVRESRGEYVAAIDFQSRYLVVSRAIRSRHDEARALLNIGVLMVATGDYVSARGYLRESRDLAREIGDAVLQTSVFGRLGFLEAQSGRLDAAGVCFKSQLALAVETGLQRDRVAALGDLGILYGIAGNTTASRRCAEVVLELARESGDRETEATALGNIGQNQICTGDYQGATETSERQLEIANRISNRLLQAQAMLDLGSAARWTGHSSESWSLAKRSLACFLENNNEGQSLEPWLLLIRVTLDDRDESRCERLLERVQPVLRRPMVRQLGIEAASKWRAQKATWGEVIQDLTALRAASENGTSASRNSAVADGFRNASRWKAWALLEGIREHRRGGRSAEAIRVRREWEQKLAERDATLDALSDCIRRGGSVADVRRLRDRTRALLEEVERRASTLRMVSPRDAELDLGTEASVDDVLRVLEGRTALIEYAEGENHLYAYVVTSDGVSFTDLGDKNAIGIDATSYETLIASSRGSGPVSGLAAFGRVVYESLLAPLLKRVGRGIDRLVIVPTPVLAGLPLDALVISHSGVEPTRDFADVEFVLDRFEVCYSPSSAVLVDLASREERREAARALIVADPSYADPSASPSSVDDIEATPSTLTVSQRLFPRRAERLLRSRDEAFDLARLMDEGSGQAADALAYLEAERSGFVKSSAFDLYVGAAATPARLRADLRAYSIVHLAAHGQVDWRRPDRTGLSLSHSRDGDGFFTISDALGLDLDAEVVVLSACETAKGRSRAGEGVQSLARALLYAGSRSVVASLWEVSDQATADLMSHFYREMISKGASPSDALRRAKLRLRGISGSEPARSTGRSTASRAAHPYFWAPFVYVGALR